MGLRNFRNFGILEIVKSAFMEATGGDIIGTYESGGKFYKYHVFNSSGNFVVTKVTNKQNY